MRAPYTEVSLDCAASFQGSSCAASRRPTAVLVDLEALAHNFREVVRRVGGRKILAVVKAEAYGHGALEVSRCVLGLGADMLGVALLEEGCKLRTGGIAAPILVMGPLFAEQAEAVVAAGITPVVFSNAVKEGNSGSHVGERT